MTAIRGELAADQARGQDHRREQPLGGRWDDRRKVGRDDRERHQRVADSTDGVRQQGVSKDADPQQ